MLLSVAFVGFPNRSSIMGLPFHIPDQRFVRLAGMVDDAVIVMETDCQDFLSGRDPAFVTADLKAVDAAGIMARGRKYQSESRIGQDG
jgi:hypothetical protein